MNEEIIFRNHAQGRRGNDSRCCVTVRTGRFPLFFGSDCIETWGKPTFFIQHDEDPEQSRDSDCWKGASQALTQEFQGSVDS